MQNESVSWGTTIDEEAAATANELVAVVMEHGTLSRYRLPGAGSVRIGRSDGSDIVIRDWVASRLHARLHIGEPLELEDAGSRNGTLLQGLRLEAGRRTGVAIGDSIQIGNAIVIIQNALASAAQWAPLAETQNNEPPPSNPVLQRAYELIGRVAPSNISVLICGETGVGKELAADRIHRCSGSRSRGPFIRVNCAALTESLFESELFGHERGSFTGAVQPKQGLLEAAHTGTVFLDEVGELPLPMQPKLLRVLESREVTRVGGLKPKPIDVRFVAATNRDLRVEIQHGRFREDLFFRLTGAVVRLPPLRERISEIEPLVRSLLLAAAREHQRPVPHVTDSSWSLLREYTWPGNIRELKNVVECAFLLAGGGHIEPAHLPLHGAFGGALGPSTPTLRVPVIPSGVMKADRRGLEREQILAALAACNGNQTRAAQYLSMPRRTLVSKLQVHDIPRPRKLT